MWGRQRKNFNQDHTHTNTKKRGNSFRFGKGSSLFYSTFHAKAPIIFL
nr:MAG TPA: hypothetical protein [Caudoviricetes sp.]